jgi:hypothetical protein
MRRLHAALQAPAGPRTQEVSQHSLPASALKFANILRDHLRARWPAEFGGTPGPDATIPNSSSNGGRSHANGIELHQAGWSESHRS